MTLALAILLGMTSGFVLALIPGLALAVALGLCLSTITSVFSPLEAACFVAAAIGGSVYAKIPGVLLNPSVGAGNLAAVDPAQRMVRDGKAGEALRLMVVATDHAWHLVGVLAVGLAFAATLGMNPVTTLNQAIGALGIPLLLYWVWATCLAAKRPLLTLAAFVVIGLYGFASLHAPALVGNPHQLAPILGGLFGFQILAANWSSQQVRKTLVMGTRLVYQKSLPWLGAGIGCATGFFAGLGAGSLVSMASSLTETDEDYVVLGTAGDVSNDLMAVILMLSAGMGRSGEAALLGRTVQGPDAFSLLAIVGSLVLAAHLGRKLVFTVSPGYAKVSCWIPSKVVVVALGTLTLIPVYLAGSGTTNGIVTSFTSLFMGIALGAFVRKAHLSNQVLFGALAIPLVFQAAGLSPVLSRMLGF